jgi:hypothetical protein
VHVYQQARDKVREKLEAEAGLVGVWSNRGASLPEAGLPLGAVATGTDTVVPFHKGAVGLAPTELRTVALSVVIVADGGTEGLDDYLDDLRAKVEPLVLEALEGFAKEVRHTGGELDMGADEDGQGWFAFLALGWDVELVTEKGKPEAVV